LTLNNNLTIATSFLGLYFNATAPSFTLNGNQITTTGAIIDNSLNFQTINLPITSTATHTYGVVGGSTMLFGGVLSGTGAGITKTLGGTLTLTNNNTYTGGTTINAGTLALNFTAGEANNILPDTALTLGGGALTVTGASAATDSQTFTGTTLNPGQNIITAINGASSGTATVTLAGLTVNPGASVVFYGPASATGGVAATGKITTSTTGVGQTTAGQDGILATGAENNTYATVGLYDWATTDSGAVTAGTTVIGGSSISGFYVVPANNSIPSGTPNWDIATQQTVTYSATTTARIGNSGGVVESLRFNTGIAPYMDVKGGFNLISGGLLVTPNMGQINVGVCELNLANTTCQIVQNNTTALLIIGISSTATSVWQAFSGSAADTTDYVVKSGAGTLVLNPISGAGFPINYTNSSGAYTVSTSGLVHAGTYDSTNEANSTSAAFYLNGGVTVINHGNQLGNPTTQGTTAGAMGTINLNGGTLMGAQNSFGLTNVAAGNAVARPVFLLGNGGGLAAQTTNTLTVPGVISGAAGTGPLTIGIPASSANGNTVGLVPGTGTNGTYITKNPAFLATGTVLLTNANTYTGNTIISSGTLKLGATGSINNSSNIIVGAGAAFDVSAISGYFGRGCQPDGERHGDRFSQHRFGFGHLWRDGWDVWDEHLLQQPDPGIGRGGLF
jgi:fibronectin-binding autotransporter adhesin